MPTPASIRSHPIHPMLIVLPLGLWIFSFASDLIYLAIGRNPLWDTIALYTMFGGVIGAVLAAVPGFIDWLSFKPGSKVRKIGAWHMVLNVGALVLYVVNAWWRTQQDVRTAGPVYLSAGIILLLTASGWLGGALIYEHGVGVEPAKGLPPSKGPNGAPGRGVEETTAGREIRRP